MTALPMFAWPSHGAPAAHAFGMPPFVREVGWTSLALAAAPTMAPRHVARAGGVRETRHELVPVLVRLAAARRALIGVAVLTRRPTDVARSTSPFIPLTRLDAAAVLLGVRSSALHPRSGVMSMAVLAANVATGVSVRRADR